MYSRRMKHAAESRNKSVNGLANLFLLRTLSKQFTNLYCEIVCSLSTNSSNINILILYIKYLLSED
jgi:hypothetical protein